MRNVLIVFLAANLAACATPPITMDQIAGIERGQQATSVQGLLRNEPDRQIETSIEGRSYIIDLYRMQTGTSTQTSVVCGKDYCTPYTYTVPVSAAFAFIYEGDRLMTWGFLEEVNKSEDPLVTRLAEEVREEQP